MAAEPGKVPAWSRAVGWFLAHGVWNTTVIGRDLVPPSGPVIVAGNHTGVIDGPVLAGVSPRPLNILVKQEMFSGPLGAVLRASGQIPVDRGNGKESLLVARSLLRRGAGVGIFPEGSRGLGQVDDVHGGATWLAMVTGAPIVPTAILGTRHEGESVSKVPRPRRRLVVEFGQPFTVTKKPGESGKIALARGNAELRERLADAVARAREKHGVVVPGIESV